MKQGQIVNKLILFLFLGVILIYVVVRTALGLSDPLLTTVSYAYSVDDTVETTGFLVRTEQVIPAQSGLIADVLPAEGEKLARGEAVAYLYRDAAALERRQTLRTLALQVEQLEYTLSKADDERDNARLTSEILSGITALRGSVERRDLTNLPETVLDLKSLVYKREYTYGDGDLTSTRQALLELNAQIAALQSDARADTTVVTAETPGIFSGVVDRYEDLLSPDMLDTLTPSQLQALSTRDLQRDDTAVGKLITDSTWYFTCTLSEAEAKRLVPGRKVPVRFSRDWSGDVEMTVERLSDPEDGRVLAVFSSNRCLAETTLLRRQTVELVFDSYTGIRVPKDAVRVEFQSVTDQDTGETREERVTGVYAMVGAQAEFKPVTILAEGEEFFLVRPAPFSNPDSTLETKKALRAGDEVIVRAEGLYDGKVLRTG